MALYPQDYTQRGEKKSYQKLKDILRLHLEKKLLDKNKSAWSNNIDGKAYAGGKKDGGNNDSQPSDGARRGDCRQWRNEGKCSRGNLCPWKHSHTPEKKGGRARSPSRQNGKDKGKSKGNGSSGEMQRVTAAEQGPGKISAARRR